MHRGRYRVRRAVWHGEEGGRCSTHEVGLAGSGARGGCEGSGVGAGAGGWGEAGRQVGAVASWYVYEAWYSPIYPGISSPTPSAPTPRIGSPPNQPHTPFKERKRRRAYNTLPQYHVGKPQSEAVRAKVAGQYCSLVRDACHCTGRSQMAQRAGKRRLANCHRNGD